MRRRWVSVSILPFFPWKKYRPEVSSQDVAVTQDGRQYRIDLVQRVQDVSPPSMDLTLAKVEQRWEVVS